MSPAGLLLAAALAQPPAGNRVELLVTPAAAPAPALRYALLPPPRDRAPGNAAVGYLRAALLLPAFPRDPKEATALNDTLIRWEDLPPDRLPVAEVKEFLTKYRETFRELDDAARLTHCDWQLAGRNRPEDIEGLLPNVSAYRELNRFLQLRAKLEIAEGRVGPALRSLQTGLQFARHVGETHTAIQFLVGLSLAQLMASRAEDLIRHPDSPNLYWALAALPRPLIDPRPALAGEADFLTGFVPGLRELEKGPVPDEQALKVFDGAVRNLARAADADSAAVSDLTGAVGRAAVVAFLAPGAKKDLLARGHPAKDVAAMPPSQAVILRAVAVHRDLWDDQAKLFFVPPTVAREGFARSAQRLKDGKVAHKGDPFFAVLALAHPALQKVYGSHARLERRLALLQAVEAVRLHAALHGGKPPVSLADVAAVPVPDDPETGKPFGYAAAGEGFTLTAPPPAGEPGAGMEYAVTLRK